MAELPLEQRAVVALCLAGGFSHGEAAEALDLPLGTVKSHVTRGRARLPEALGGPAAALSLMVAGQPFFGLAAKHDEDFTP